MRGSRSSWVSHLAVVAFQLLLQGCLSLPTQAYETEVRYFTRDGVRFAYRLDMPPGPGPHPAVVLVHGAGRRQTIDNLQGWVSQLLPLGIGVLRYDKRGTGLSRGRYRNVGPQTSATVIPELAGDAAAAFDLLRGLPGVDPARVGFFGGSQAGWIIPEASLAAEANFAIILSGPAVPVGLEIRHAKMFAQGLDSADLRADLRAFRGPRGYDPRPALEGMHIPVIWFLGTLDERVPVPETLAILEEIQTQGDRDWTVKVYPDVNHSLRHVDTNEPVPLWEELEAWIARTLGPTRTP